VNRDPRQQELLVQRALEGLTDAENLELRALGGEGDESLELAAAALHLSALPPAELPAHVAARILSGQAPRPVVVPIRKNPARWPGWLAAAACLAFAVGVWAWAAKRPPRVVRVEVPTPPVVASVPAPVTVEQERARLLASAPDVTTVAWKATNDPGASGASGDVVWSNAEQAGFMRFAGLTPNDPAHTQYQLWIFDKDRDGHYPIDGGVFDVPPGGDVVVPIRAKLHVDEPTLFAVTIEKPGGVVVSKREHIVVTAATAG
jgi:Anti-sigma-K factor rskA